MLPIPRKRAGILSPVPSEPCGTATRMAELAASRRMSRIGPVSPKAEAKTRSWGGQLSRRTMPPQNSTQTPPQRECSGKSPDRTAASVWQAQQWRLSRKSPARRALVNRKCSGVPFASPCQRPRVRRRLPLLPHRHRLSRALRLFRTLLSSCIQRTRWRTRNPLPPRNYSQAPRLLVPFPNRSRQPEKWRCRDFLEKERIAPRSRQFIWERR